MLEERWGRGSCCVVEDDKMGDYKYTIALIHKTVHRHASIISGITELYGVP